MFRGREQDSNEDHGLLRGRLLKRGGGDATESQDATAVLLLE